jgi:hypothetical protein
LIRHKPELFKNAFIDERATISFPPPVLFPDPLKLKIRISPTLKGRRIFSFLFSQALRKPRHHHPLWPGKVMAGQKEMLESLVIPDL